MATETPAKSTKAEPQEEKFSAERLIAEGPILLGVPGFVVAGALHGARASSFTLAEASTAVDRYNKKEA